MNPTVAPADPPHLEFRLYLLRARLAVLCPDPAYRDAVFQTVSRTLKLIDHSGAVRPGGRPGEGSVRELVGYCDRVEVPAVVPPVHGDVRLMHPGAYSRHAKLNGFDAMIDSKWFQRAVRRLDTDLGDRAERRAYVPLTGGTPREPLPCVTAVQFLPNRAGRTDVVLTLRSSNAASELMLDLLYWAETARCLPPEAPLGHLHFTAASAHVHVGGEAALDLVDYLGG